MVVRLSLDSNNIQHEKFVLQLVKPYVEGFSVPPLLTETDDQNEMETDDNKKRKYSEEKKDKKKGRKRK